VKLLFDENLSYRLVGALDNIYPGSAHVRDVGLLGAGDSRIWEHAASNGLLLTSKDTDFYQRSLLFGAPPKIIWLRVGNAPTSLIADILRQQYLLIRRFAEDSDATVLILPAA
jgi:predicted nuclease of predicted toxin-antitoxin system